MNTSKRKQKAIRLGIAAVLALVLLVSVSVVLVIANTPETEPVQADAMKVTLDGKVNLIFKFNDGKVKSGTVSYYTAVIGESGRKIERLEPVKDGENRDVVTVPLMPYEMTETVSLYHVDKDGNKLAVSTGSVGGYADEVLESNDDAAHHNKIRALLNYGAKTQIDAEKNTSNLANNGLFVRNDPIDIIKEVPFGALDEKTGDTKYFEDKASVSLAFKGGDILLRYTVNGVDSAPTATFTYNEENHIGTFVPQEDGSYKFDISNVGVNNFDTVWDVTITSGEHKITSHHSVLEYLNYLVTSTDEKITAEEKDVARSLYQLYQNTVGGLLADCKHLNPGYYIPAGENSSYHMCAACGKEINADPIDNKITAYFSGEHLSGIKAIGGVDATYSEGNGYQITWKTAGSALELIWLREAYYTSTYLKKADGQWGDVPFDIGNAKYLVIRYKVNAGSGITGITASLGSTKLTYEDTGALVDGTFVPKKDPYDKDYPASQTAVYSTKTVSGNGSTDCTAILYLDDFGDKVKADANGNRVIDGLKLGIAANMAAVNDTLTIESIEFVTHLGECVNVDGDEYCDDCGKVLPTSAYIMNGEYLMNNKWSANGVHSLDKDGTFVAERDEKGRAWMLLTNNNADRAVVDKYSPFSVGKSEYIVIKYKVPNYTPDEGATTKGGGKEAFRLILSTENGPVSKAPGSKDDPQSFDGISPIYIDPYANDGVKAENEDGWTYMVIHAPTVMLNYKKEPVYVPDATTGEYVIDCFYIEPRQNSGCDSHFEIGYIAFAETLNDVETLFADDAANDALIENVIMAKESRVTLSYGVNPTKNDKVVEKVVNGKIQHGNMKTTMTEGVPSTVCTVCNRPVLPENTFIDGNLLAQVPAADSTNCTVSTITDGDNNIYYHAKTTAETGTEHLWFREPYKGSDITTNTTTTLDGASGKLSANHNVPGFTTVTDDKMTLANSAVVLYPDYPALNVGTARYLVIRARTNFTSAKKAFYLYMGTVGFHNPEKKAADQRIGVRFNTANDGNWITYVLDLEKVANFEINGEKRAPTVKDANGNDILIFDSFYLGLQVGDMDIDYIAFVNKLSDVADITEDASVRIMNDVTSGASKLTDKADLKN